MRKRLHAILCKPHNHSLLKSLCPLGEANGCTLDLFRAEKAGALLEKIVSERSFDCPGTRSEQAARLVAVHQVTILMLQMIGYQEQAVYDIFCLSGWAKTKSLEFLLGMILHRKT